MDYGNFKLGGLVIYLSIGFFFFLSSIGYNKYGFPGKDSTCKEETSV